MAWPARRVFRVFWWMLTTATLCALPLTIWEFKKQGYDTHYMAWFIGGIFVIITVPISIYEVAMHTEYYTRPKLQRHVIRILWMVPIYALDAWFALRFKDARIYLDPIRECYEAYVIYNFFAYLLSYLEDEVGNVEQYVAEKPPMHHMWGVSYLMKPWRMGPEFLWECKKGVLNYVILRPACTVIALVSEHFDKYGEGQIDPRKTYVWVALITNCSQMWALYCLAQMYVVMHAELKPIRPLSKFICVKAVVFLTFWQQVGIAVMVWLGIIRTEEQFTTYTAGDVAAGLQEFLICIEMFLAGIAHAYAFPPKDYMDPNIPTKGFFTNVRYMFDLRDVVIDVQEVVEDQVQRTTHQVTRYSKRAVKKTVRGLVNTPGQLLSFITTGGKGSRQRGGESDSDEDSQHRALLDMDENHSSNYDGHSPKSDLSGMRPEESLFPDEGQPLQGMNMGVGPSAAAQSQAHQQQGQQQQGQTLLPSQQQSTLRRSQR